MNYTSFIESKRDEIMQAIYNNIDYNMLIKQEVRTHRVCLYVSTSSRSADDCLIYKMLFIKKLRPSLNIQAYSVHAKLTKLCELILN